MEPRARSTRTHAAPDGLDPAGGGDPRGLGELVEAVRRLEPAACPEVVVAPGSPVDVATDWRTWLCGSPREVLARIVPGDPIGVREAVAAALRAECVFLDADRVHLRALALVARGAARYRGRPELGAWLAGEARRAVAAILREDAEATRVDPGGAFAQLARPLGLDPDALRRGCTAFNRLPAADRAAFFGLAICNRRLDDLVRETGASATEIARAARRGLDAVMLPSPAGPTAPARPAPGARSTDRRTDRELLDARQPRSDASPARSPGAEPAPAAVRIARGSRDRVVEPLPRRAGGARAPGRAPALARARRDAAGIARGRADLAPGRERLALPGGRLRGRVRQRRLPDRAGARRLPVPASRALAERARVDRGGPASGRGR